MQRCHPLDVQEATALRAAQAPQPETGTGTPLPGPLFPATSRVSLCFPALFCLVRIFTLANEKHRIFPRTRQNEEDVIRRNSQQERRVGKECRSRWSPY